MALPGGPRSARPVMGATAREIVGYEPAPPPDVYVVETDRGFTETFTARTVRVLVDLGLIVHVESRPVVVGGRIHHFYRGAHCV